MYNTHQDKIPASWAIASLSHHEAENKVNGAMYGSPCTNGTCTNGSDSHYTNGTTHTNGAGAAKEKGSVPDFFLEEKAVRTVYGLVPLKDALDWPVFASYDELARCAVWMGGRIPTFEETRSLYVYVEERKKKQAEKKLGRTVPAVNGYISFSFIFSSEL
jgi:hypothetical protein